MSSVMVSGTREKEAQKRSVIESPMRARSRQEARFSRRERVGWLIGSSPLSGSRPAGQLEGRIGPKAVQVVGVLVAASDRQHARADHLVIAVLHARRVALIGQAGGEKTGDPQPGLDLAQNHNPAVRGQPPAIETGDQILAIDG